MRIVWSVVVLAVVLSFACTLRAESNVMADKVVDIAESKVSYNIKTTGGEELVITADYAQTRPSPEIENMDIAPADFLKDGVRSFRIMSKEGVPIEIQYSYALGEHIGTNILAQPPGPSSDVEYSQVLSVESTGGHIVNFTFIWQGKDIKEVRIEPAVNPFTAD